MSNQDAIKIGLTDEEYNTFKKAGILTKCTPSQECTWGSASGVFSSLCDQYDIDEIFGSTVLEHKKAKELFLGSLFSILVKQDTKNKYSVGVPLEDRGVDLFVREINFEEKLVSMLEIQICEFKGKYSKEGLFRFVVDKIDRYGTKILANTLLVWLEPVNVLKQAEIEECAQQLTKLYIPFRQIVVMGMNEDKGIFIISEIYSVSHQDLWSMKFDYRKFEIVEKGYLPKRY